MNFNKSETQLQRFRLLGRLSDLRFVRERWSSKDHQLSKDPERHRFQSLLFFTLATVDHVGEKGDRIQLVLHSTAVFWRSNTSKPTEDSDPCILNVPEALRCMVDSQQSDYILNARNPMKE